MIGIADIKETEMLRYSYIVLATVLFLSPVFLITPAVGQSATGQADTAAGQYSKQELKSYAEASLDVDRINEAYVKQLSQTEGAVAKEKLRQVAMDQMIKAINKSDISLEKYNKITVQSGDNSTLANQINQLKQKLQ